MRNRGGCGNYNCKRGHFNGAGRNGGPTNANIAETGEIGANRGVGRQCGYCLFGYHNGPRLLARRHGDGNGRHGNNSEKHHMLIL